MEIVVEEEPSGIVKFRIKIPFFSRNNGAAILAISGLVFLLTALMFSKFSYEYQIIKIGFMFIGAFLLLLSLVEYYLFFQKNKVILDLNNKTLKRPGKKDISLWRQVEEIIITQKHKVRAEYPMNYRLGLLENLMVGKKPVTYTSNVVSIKFKGKKDLVEVFNVNRKDGYKLYPLAKDFAFALAKYLSAPVVDKTTGRAIRFTPEKKVLPFKERELQAENEINHLLKNGEVRTRKTLITYQKKPELSQEVLTINFLVNKKRLLLIGGFSLLIFGFLEGYFINNQKQGTLHQLDEFNENTIIIGSLFLIMLIIFYIAFTNLRNIRDVIEINLSSGTMEIISLQGMMNRKRKIFQIKDPVTCEPVHYYSDQYWLVLIDRKAQQFYCQNRYDKKAAIIVSELIEKLKNEVST